MPEHIHTETASTDLYVVIANAAGQRWNGSAFEDFDVLNWGDYDVPLSESPAGSYRYPYSVPGAASAGFIEFFVYEQVGVSPAVSDTLLDTEKVLWDGSAVVDTLLTVEGVRAEMDSNSTKLASVDSKTTNLPASPAAVSDIPTADANATAVTNSLERSGGPIKETESGVNTLLGDDPSQASLS